MSVIEEIVNLLTGLFGGGEFASLAIIFVIFMIDAMIFPLLPELFFILAFTSNQSNALYGAELLLAATLGEIVGVLILYFIVEHLRIPRGVQKVVGRYVGFLILHDERMLLVNRIAPMIPFTGAFISIAEKWEFKRCMLYLITGCVLKYGALLVLSNVFYAYFSDTSTAQAVSVVMVLVIMAASFAAAYYRKRKAKAAGSTVKERLESLKEEEEGGEESEDNGR